MTPAWKLRPSMKEVSVPPFSTLMPLLTLLTLRASSPGPPCRNTLSRDSGFPIHAGFLPSCLVPAFDGAAQA